MAGYPVVLRRPPRHPRAVLRPRLATWPAGAGALILVGPAGAGKTVAALQAAGAHGGRVVWCRLAPGYGSAADLVGLAHAAAETAPPEVAADPVSLAGGLLALLEAEPTVLVVDDYGSAEAGECDTVLAEVVPLVPPDSGVVVATRTRPAGLLGRLPAGTVQVVDADGLAFREDEAVLLFESCGRTDDVGRSWRELTGGWAAALGVAAETGAEPGDATALAELVDGLVVGRLDDESRRLLEVLAVLPWLTGGLAADLGMGDEAGLRSLAAATTLVVEAGGRWRLHDVARPAVAARVDADQRTGWLVATASALAATEPVTAVELWLDADRPSEAADLLAARVSEVGVDRAVRFVYRLPAELRRRLPPVLTGGRATVDLDAAIAHAAERVDAAATDDERVEALLALGSAHAGAGDLAGAVGALEAAAGPEAAPSRPVVALWLGIVRWWAGDLAGASAALAGAGDGTWAWWARGHVLLAGGDVEGAEAAADRSVAAVAEGETAAAGASLLTAVALLRGDVEGAAGHAAVAYSAGVGAGGLDLACGGLAQAWVAVATGDHDDALAAADLVARRVGRHDHHARLGAALVRLAVATAAGDTGEREAAGRRVRDLRRPGFAPVEQVARRLLAPLAPAGDEGLRVDLLGAGRVVVDGVVRSDTWRSRKALEVLRHLAVVGPGGRPREAVIEAIWPGRPPENGRTLLRTALSEVRRVLEPDRHPGEPSRFVVTTRDRVAIGAASDVADARRLVAEHRHPDAFALLAPGVCDLEGAGDSAEDLGREVDRLRLTAAEGVAEGDGPDAVTALDVLIAAEPWRRDLHDRLAAVHRAAGDEQAARDVERRWFADE